MKIRSLIAALVLAAPVAFSGAPAKADEPFLGEIRMFGFNFCPRNWAPADGRILQIVDYQALFSLLGTNYGGDGRTTFGLPDLRGRYPMAQGTGPGLPDARIGTRAGGVYDGQPGKQVSAAYQVVNMCVALFGVYPSRN